jgi:hypothetical protein
MRLLKMIVDSNPERWVNECRRLFSTAVRLCQDHSASSVSSAKCALSEPCPKIMQPADADSCRTLVGGIQ